MSLQVVEQNVFEPPINVVIHQMNCVGEWGIGELKKEIVSKFPNVKQADDERVRHDDPRILGRFLVVNVSNSQIHPNLNYVINLYYQFICGEDKKRYTDYEALYMGLYDLKNAIDSMEEKELVFGIPYGLGCRTGGGSWNIVYAIINEVFKDTQSDVRICRKSD